MVHENFIDTQLAELFRHTGIDLSTLPPIMDSARLGSALGITSASLAQDRYRNRGIPYVKVGRRVRYLRSDVTKYLIAHREGGDDGGF